MLAHHDMVGDAQHVDAGLFGLARDIDHPGEVAAYQPFDSQQTD
jgi:hypothetical protein